MNCTPTASFSITNRKFKILLLVFQDDKENFSPEEFGREGMEFCAPVPNTLEKCKNSALFLRLDRPSNRKRSLNRRNLETPILCFSVDVNILKTKLFKKDDVTTVTMIFPSCSSCTRTQMGPLHDPVTWYKITYTGEQVAQWDFQNNATRTSSPGPVFDMEVPLCNLLAHQCM